MAIMIRDDNGQAVIEASVGILLLSTAFTLALALLYVGFARAWIGYQSDQALFCLAENQPVGACRSAATASARRFLPFGETVNLDLRQIGHDQWRSEWNWQWNKIKLRKRKTLKWDLQLWR